MSGSLNGLQAPQGRLTENILHFCRALRRAGIPVGPAQALSAIRAVEVAGFTRRADFFFTLRACLVSRAEHLDLFERVFSLFWRDPEFIERMVQTMLPMQTVEPPPRDPKAAERRALEAMLEDTPPPPPPEREAEEIELDMQMSFSQAEKIKSMDFEQMSAAEVAEAKRALAQLELPIKRIVTRRMTPAPRGPRADVRATLRAARRTGGEILRLPRRAPGLRNPDLVAICDISGSMSTYSRMFMHFLHTLSLAKGQAWARVHSFTFGTRLTNITRQLTQRDPDAAMKAVGAHAQDWEGGTRIGASLAEFNKHWSRRVLARGAVVLLVTDGLERGDTEELAREAARLRRSCRQLIWLNPLMRWEGFAPEAAGIRALLPNVDTFQSCHNIESLEGLAEVLSSGSSGERDRLMAMMRT